MKHIFTSKDELTLIIVVIGVTVILTAQRRSPSILSELFRQPFGMVELLDQSSLIQMSGDHYMHMLQTHFWPAFAALPNKDQFVFMQDGAPPHWSRPVRDWLREKLPNRWAGRGADTDLNVKWPPSLQISPHVTSSCVGISRVRCMLISQ